MKLEILNTSVVVLAKNNNPSILHPTFLSSENIVPSEWEVAEPPVSTPVFAMVKYKNGTVFIVEENRFQVRRDEFKDDVVESSLPVLAIKYVKKLPYVKYQAAGINFKGFFECTNPEILVTERFLKPGTADINTTHPEASGFRFVYLLEETRLRLSFDSGKVKHGDNEKERSGILIDSNYHIDLVGDDITEEIEKVTSLYFKHYKHFIGVAQSMLIPEVS